MPLPLLAGNPDMNADMRLQCFPQTLLEWSTNRIGFEVRDEAEGSTDELVSHRSVRRERTSIHAQHDKNEEIIIYYVSSTMDRAPNKSK